MKKIILFLVLLVFIFPGCKEEKEKIVNLPPQESFNPCVKNNDCPKGVAE